MQVHRRPTMIATMLACATLAGGLVIVAAVPASAAAAPIVFGISPGSGGEGTAVAIEGTGLSGATQVLFGASAGTSLTVVSVSRLTVDAPAGSIGSSVDVRVVTPSGTSATTGGDRFGYVAAPKALTYSATQTIDASTGGPRTVSCTSKYFCMLATSTGKAYRFHNRRWGTGTKVAANLWGISCVNHTFCIAGTEAGKVVEWNGKRWGSPKALPGTRVARRIEVSCVSRHYCAAVGGSPAFYFYNGQHWTKSRAEQQPRYGFDDVSCTAARYCLAVNGASEEQGHDSRGFTRVFNKGRDPVTDACITGDNCAVINNSGRSLNRFDRSGYLSSHYVHLNYEYKVEHFSSCPTTSFCAFGEAEDGDSVLTTHGPSGNGQKYTRLSSHASVVAVSCPSSHFCAAFTADGVAHTRTHSTWHTGRTVNSSSGILTDVSCGTTTSCTAVDSQGFEVRGTGTTWQAPQRVSTHGALNTVSCPTAGFCATGGQNGYAYTVADGRINGAHLAGDVDDVSCATVSYCVALLDGPQQALEYSVWNGSYWKGGGTVPGSGSNFYQFDVSCGAAGVCWVASQRMDRKATLISALRNGKWSTTTFAESYLDDAAVISCADATHCTLSEGNARYQYLANGVWSPLNDFGDGGENFYEADPTTLSCPTANYCANDFHVANSEPDGDGVGDHIVLVDPAGYIGTGTHGVDAYKPTVTSCPVAGTCVLINQRLAAKGTS